MIAVNFLMVQSGSAGSATTEAYNFGYDHGCDDAGIAPSDRYINQPRKGSSFHTNEFMDGYNDGFDACSVGDNSTIIIPIAMTMTTLAMKI